MIEVPLPPRSRSSIRPILRQRRSDAARFGSVRFEATSATTGRGAADAIRCRRRPLRPDALQPLRPQRARAARDLARALAELRRHHPARDGPGDRAPRLRSRRHALRPREQLRPALRLRGGELRPDHAGRPPALPRRARDLDEGGLRHVARARTATAARGSTSSRASTRASTGSASTTSTSSTRIASTPRRRSRRRWARSTAPSGRARRSTSGISSYSAEKTREAHAILRDLGTPLLIHQPSYSILNRWIEPDLVETLGELGVGCITFSPLAQGVLTDRYLNGIPEGSRASRNDSLAPETLTEAALAKVQGAERRSPRRAASRSPRWRSPGRCATRGSPRRSSAPAASPSSSRTSVPSTTWRSRPRSSHAIDGHAPESAVNIWAGSSDR